MVVNKQNRDKLGTKKKNQSGLDSQVDISVEQSV